MYRMQKQFDVTPSAISDNIYVYIYHDKKRTVCKTCMARTSRFSLLCH